MTLLRRYSFGPNFRSFSSQSAGYVPRTIEDLASKPHAPRDAQITRTGSKRANCDASSEVTALTKTRPAADRWGGFFIFLCPPCPRCPWGPMVGVSPLYCQRLQSFRRRCSTRDKVRKKQESHFDGTGYARDLQPSVRSTPIREDLWARATKIRDTIISIPSDSRLSVPTAAELLSGWKPLRWRPAASAWRLCFPAAA